MARLGSRARRRPWPLVASAALALLLPSGCDEVPLSCASTSDCPSTGTCADGVCISTPPADGDAHVDEGEGDEGEGVESDHGEGEGDEGEGGEGEGGEGEGGEGEGGEGEGGEGEGSEGEGSEGEGSEGEGSEGEGEGEGAAGEGEGEGGDDSCLAVHLRDPTAASGAYAITVGGLTRNVECDMETRGGGWALLLRFDDGDACPGQWIDAPVGGCRRQIDAPQTAAFVASPYAWAEMRGEVRGFGFGGSDSFNTDTNSDINGVYVDGLTFTRGSAPREHVFTFVHGDADDFANPSASCPCAGGPPSPSFVGASYLCEMPQSCTGTPRRYDTNDVLFDGLLINAVGCQGAAESAPSFAVNLGTARDDDLEMRLMGSAAEGTLNEDLAVIHMELWVR